MSYTDIINSLKEKKAGQKEDINEILDKIIELDGSKIPYDQTIQKIDLDIVNSFGSINSGINSVKDAYQNRINVGCRTDMFWRVVGATTSTYTVTVTQLSEVGYANIVGFGTTTITVFNGSVFTTYFASDTFGFSTQNYYGVKYYDTPVTKDIEDTFVTSFIGTIGVGSSILTVLSPVGSSSTIAIKSGQFVQSSKSGVLPSSSNVVGIYQTTTTPVASLGIASTTLVTALTLDTVATGSASAPESNGSFVTFTVLKSSDQFQYDLNTYEEFSTKSPSSPQTIGVLDTQTLGVGVSIAYSNAGGYPYAQTWYPDLEDLGDPDDPEIPPTLEPNVGPGASYYKVGFAYYPVAFSGTATTVRASLGFTTTVTAAQLSGITTTLGSTCPTQDSAITSALSALSGIQTSFNNDLNNLNLKLSAANALRRERESIQLSIWNSRQELANNNIDLINIDETLSYLGISTITNILE
jgi:hypothetical protein